MAFIHTDTKGSEARCNFCGNTEKDIRTMVRSDEGATICYRCAVVALDIISHVPGQVHLRAAWGAFRAIAFGLGAISRLVRRG
jgi:hypothetical protein